MQCAKWSLVTLIFVSSVACSRRQSIPANLPNVRDPRSTTADLAVPMCPARFNDSLATNGIATEADKGVTLPLIAHSAEPELSDEAGAVLRKTRKKKGVSSFDATNLISLVVDERGNPQNLCIWQSRGYGLDANGAKAIQQYTFHPATKGGMPVPYRITIKMSYCLYGRDR
jgi:hypothetical protein